MEIKKGSKLKILSKKKVPLGPQYSKDAIRRVKSKGAKNHAMREQVSQRVDKPCRPRLDVIEAWAPGDVVEVFDNNSWKMATVSEVLGKMHILVRLLGSSQEFKVRKTDIRARQPWKDDGGARIMVGKGNKNNNGGNLYANQLLDHSPNSTSQVQTTNSTTTLWKQDHRFAIRNKTVQDNYNVRSLKRSNECSSGAFYGASHKVRLIEKQGRYVKVVATNPTRLPEPQVGLISYLRGSLGERHNPTSLNHRLGGDLELGVEGKVPVNPVRELNDEDSIMCSVGSCSIGSDNSSDMPCDDSVGFTEQIAGHLRDDQAPHHSGFEGHCPSTEDDLAAEIHRLELRAYRCTIEALHASGPLSWEQEDLITNLRFSLNISNDEHLMQLKYLISADTSIPI